MNQTHTKSLSFLTRLGITLCILLLAATTLTACNTTSTAQAEDKITVIATTFPQYDWLREIIGAENDNVELTLLVDNGVDLHSYQPSAADIAAISSCDVFVYNGGQSDLWVEDVLKTAQGGDTVTINLMEVLGNSVKEEVIKEGMEHDHEAGADHETEEGAEHDHEAEGEHSHENEQDEHIWLSLKNAETLCLSLASTMSEVDTENASAYEANVAAYIEKLDQLDQEYTQAVENASANTLLFGDRFPFRYMVDDYGIDYYAAFSGCSAETEASFETIIYLAGKVDELGLNNVMAIEGSNHSIAETIIKNTSTKDQEVLVMDSIQAVTSPEIDAGTTYLSIMKANLETLQKALDA